MPLITWVVEQEAEEVNEKMARNLVRGAGRTGLRKIVKV